MNNHKDVIYNVVVWNNVVLMYLSVLSVSENPSSYLPIKYSRKFVYAPEVFCLFFSSLCSCKMGITALSNFTLERMLW